MISKKYACLFCGKQRPESGPDTWLTWMILLPAGHAFTICPQCRSRTLRELYHKISELQERELSNR